MNFAALGLKDTLLLTLNRLHYDEPTSVQMKTIPPALAGRDIVATAGTGKTAAFALPVIQSLMKEHPRMPAKTMRSLVLVSDRYQAENIYHRLKYYGMSLPVRIVAVHGGAEIDLQIMKLRCGTDILVATPNRLKDLYYQGAVDFSQLQTFVIDDMDRLVSLGYAAELMKLAKVLPEKRQTILFTQSFSEDLDQLAQCLSHRPLLIDMSDTAGSA